MSNYSRAIDTRGPDREHYPECVLWRGALTWPNFITLVRLALLPVFVIWLFDDRVVAAGFLLGFIGATDWVDGWVARRFDQVSELGKILDPIADRGVFLVGIVSVIGHGSFPLWFGVAIVAREASIAALMVGATLLGMERFDVTRRGKTATFALLCAVPWITLGSVGGGWSFFSWVGWAVGVPGLALSWLTFFEYLPLVRAHMAAGRAHGALPLDE